LISTLKICAEKNVLVVLLKAGTNKNNVWSAGHDIYELPEGRRDPLSFFDAIEVLLRESQRYPGPVIAVVRGSFWGAACDLIMTCDLVCADRTSSFAITPAKIGIPYNVTGIMHFINRIGLNQAKEMFFTASPVDAETAAAWGILNHLFESDELDAKVLEIAEQICQNSPLAVGVIKNIFTVYRKPQWQCLRSCSRESAGFDARSTTASIMQRGFRHSKKSGSQDISAND
jgi:methylmalonyl-CoA decarboxylase